MVYDAWLKRQKRPEMCRYTAEREALLIKRLALGYSVEDLQALIRYAYESDDPGPRWWRGDNEKRVTYLDLTSLLREEKLGARVTAALTWAAEPAITETVPVQAPDPSRGLRLIQGGRRIQR